MKAIELRKHAMALLDQGLSCKEVAQQLGIDPLTVSAWKAHATRGSYQSSTSGPASEEMATDGQIEVAERTTFAMERDLQKALRANIAQLQPDLRIVDGGKERQTDAGNIDITAEDSSGATVVIELKAGEAQPEALTQLLAYMGALDQDRPVRGILIAGDFHQRLTHAAKVVPNVVLRRYSHKFTFDPLA
jgi:transposase-like protein